MDGYPEDYGRHRGHSSAEYRAALAAVHEAQDHRIALVALADAHLGIARCLVKLDRRRNTPAACGRALRAVELYSRAGLGRRAAAALRWARFARRQSWRDAAGPIAP